MRQRQCRGRRDEFARIAGGDAHAALRAHKMRTAATNTKKRKSDLGAYHGSPRRFRIHHSVPGAAAARARESTENSTATLCAAVADVGAAGKLFPQLRSELFERHEHAAGGLRHFLEQIKNSGGGLLLPINFQWISPRSTCLRPRAFAAARRGRGDAGNDRSCAGVMSDANTPLVSGMRLHRFAFFRVGPVDGQMHFGIRRAAENNRRTPTHA